MKKALEIFSSAFQEARAGFEPAITVLQTGALPLGDRALLSFSTRLLYQRLLL